MIFRAFYIKCAAIACIAITTSLLLVHCGFCSQSKVKIPMNMVDNLRSKHEIADVVALFPRTVEEINEMGVQYIAEARNKVDAIIAVPAHERTFANTVGALDAIAISDLYFAASFGWLLDVASPQESIRKAASELSKNIRNFYIEYMGGNKQLYEAFKAYADGNARHEKLTPQQQYCLDETIKNFERYYAHLPKDQREHVAKIKKELGELEALFQRNIAADPKSITVDLAGLAGLEQGFIDALKKTDSGLYILDESSYSTVMNSCQLEDTRKRLYYAFSNRAYPANEQVLKDIIAKRDELAKNLGFASYIDVDFSNQMAKTPDRMQHFIMDLVEQSAKKEKQELALWLAHKPNSVALTADDKIKPWDIAYLQNNYKIHNFSVNNQKIAEYFPAEKTVEKLLDVYGKFFSINFQQLPATGLWHDSVQAIAVFNKDRTQLLGYLFLDLFARPGKDASSCYIRVVPPVLDENNQYIAPVVSVVITNFPHTTDNKSSLLNHAEVRTFVRELGRAIHELLGVTHFPSYSGTSRASKDGFKYFTSHILEEWLWDADILQLVSGHYLTGEPLSQTMIDAMIALRQYNFGYWLTRDEFSSLLFLNLFKEGEKKNLHQMWFDLRTQLTPDLMYDIESHPYASFNYNSHDYEYLWSKVRALDLFEEIKKQGLLDPVIGQRYVDEVISKGSSQDPNELLHNFLHREPNNKAFLKSMGL